MPEIKISLTRLITLFGKSVNADLPQPVRALAARIMTLTAHVLRIDQRVDGCVKQAEEQDKQIAELTEMVHVIAQRTQQGIAPATTPSPASPVATSLDAPPADQQTEQTEEGSEEAQEQEFFENAQREAEAEVAAVNANLPPEPAPAPKPAPLAVIPRGKKAGGAK